MGFGESIRVCFQKYAQFSGRASRSEYWWFSLFLVVASIALTILEGILFGFEMETFDIAKVPFSTAFILVTLIPSASAPVRRLHDMGRSGWALLWPAVAFTALAVVSLLLLVYQSAYLHFGGNTPLGMLLLAVVVIPALATLTTFVMVIWWLTRPSEPGPNRYGPVPGPYV